MLPNCSELMHAMGWACKALSTIPAALYVSTPLLLPGGKPLDFYLTADGKTLHFTDDGLTVFGLRGLGYTLDNRRNLRGMEQIAETLGFTLDDTECFIAKFPASELSLWSGKILRLFSRVLDWEVDHFQSSDADLSLTTEVERLMRLKDPDRDIQLSPVLQLQNGDSVSFHFRWGDQYVDAVPPTARAVGARLRKALQVQREDPTPERMLFIIDDRQDDQRAAVNKELAIFGQVTRAVRLTDFARLPIAA